MTNEITSKGLVHFNPSAAGITVEREHSYPTAQGPLSFELYRPLASGAPAPLASSAANPASPAVVLVTGYADPGAAAMFGKPFKDWAFYGDWARLVAASGIAAITYVNREPTDVFALLHHLRSNASALGLDPARIGIWSSSGHVPTALAVMAREPLACAVLLYGYLLDLDGATSVAEAATQFRFAVPPVALEELPPELPTLLVRAGRDQTPGLDATLQRFVAAARRRAMAVTLLDHPEAPHAFDLLDDSPRTHEVIEEVLAFLRRALSSAAAR